MLKPNLNFTVIRKKGPIAYCSTIINGLPMIVSLYLRKDFWDRHRANIASC